MRRVIAAALLATLLLATEAPAQQAGGRRVPRRWLGAAIGMLVTGAGALVYALAKQRDIESPCSSTSCVATFSLVLGFGAGFLIGREFDQLHALRYRHGPPLTLRGQQIPLSVIPLDVAARGGTVAAAGEGGVEIFSGGARLERADIRARGLRGVVSARPEPARNRLLVGTTVGLYGFGLEGARTTGDLLAPGEVSALALEDDRALVATGASLIAARLDGDTLEASGTARAFEARVTDLAWGRDGRVAWVLTEGTLIAMAVGDSGLADSLGAFPLFTEGRRLAILRDTLAIAAGEGGVFLLDVSDPRAPRQVAQWSGARFAYDVALGPRAVYLAAGPEGLYVLSPRAEGSMTALGLARNLGFVAALDADGSDLYLIDRSGGLLRRIPFAN